MRRTISGFLFHFFTGYGYAVAIISLLGLSAGYNVSVAGDIQSEQNAPFLFNMSCAEQNDLCTAHDIIAEASCKKVFFSVDSDQNLHLEIFEHEDDVFSSEYSENEDIIALPEDAPDVKAWFLYEAVKCGNLNAAYGLANLMEEGTITSPAKVSSKDLYRFVTVSDVKLAQGKEVCIQRFDDMLNNETSFFDVKTPAHIEQVKWAQNLCTYDEQELQETAKDYLDENDPNWHAIIAYSILNQINSTDGSIIDLRSQAARKGWPQLEKDLSARANLYFPSLQFAEYEAGTCEEFKETYLKPDAKNVLFYWARVYHTGACGPQDLRKAQRLYQELYDNDPGGFGLSSFWLGLIYQYGPEDIRDLDKARFFYKQAILTLAWDDSEEAPQLRRQVARSFIDEQLPIPELLESELVWLEDVLKKPAEERKRISEELEKEGYAHFEYLYTPPIDRVSFKERPDIDHDKFSPLSTEEKIDALTFSGLTFLYREYEDEQIFGELNDAYRLNEFRLTALQEDEAELQKYISDMKDARVDAPEFIDMLQAAIEWARPEKQRDAEELYELSQNFTSSYGGYLLFQQQAYRDAYLALSATKGHEQAQIEMKEQERELREFIKQKEKEWRVQSPPHP